MALLRTFIRAVNHFIRQRRAEMTYHGFRPSAGKDESLTGDPMSRQTLNRTVPEVSRLLTLQ